MSSPSKKPLTQGVLDPSGGMVRAEIVVIGSGPGGAITAALLAEAGRDVILIEEGPHLELDSCTPFSSEEMLQKYRNGGITVALGKPKIAYVEGRCVGGGSEINSGLYHRTPPDILEEWRRGFSVDCLSEKDLLPHFEACEKDLHVSYLQGPAPAASQKLHEGACKLGWKSQEVPRWWKPGAGGGRQSMTQTFVPRFLSAGGRICPDTRVLRLRRQPGRWQVGIEARVDGLPVRRGEIEAGTVFVACGAIQTPALLRRSGVTRLVGNSLQMHPTVKVCAVFPQEVNAADMGVPVHQVKEFAPRFSFGCSISSPPHLALALADQSGSMEMMEQNWRRMAIYYAMTCGGKGKVRPLPLFQDALLRYRLSASDLADLAEALKHLCQCLFAAGAETLYPSIAGWPPLKSPNDVAALPSVLPADRTNLMTIHLFGTCPMGENQVRCPVDSFGKVRGVDGLYVADASLLCGPPGVNPQGTIMAIVRRNALRFLGHL